MTDIPRTYPLPGPTSFREQPMTNDLHTGAANPATTGEHHIATIGGPIATPSDDKGLVRRSVVLALFDESEDRWHPPQGEGVDPEYTEGYEIGMADAMCWLRDEIARLPSPPDDENWQEVIGWLPKEQRRTTRISTLSSREAVLREAAAIGLEYVIEAANERKQKDAVFDNAMRHIRRIERALSPDGGRDGE